MKQRCALTAAHTAHGHRRVHCTGSPLRRLTDVNTNYCHGGEKHGRACKAWIWQCDSWGRVVYSPITTHVRFYLIPLNAPMVPVTNTVTDCPELLRKTAVFHQCLFYTTAAVNHVCTPHQHTWTVTPALAVAAAAAVVSTPRLLLYLRCHWKVGSVSKCRPYLTTSPDPSRVGGAPSTVRGGSGAWHTNLLHLLLL